MKEEQIKNYRGYWEYRMGRTVKHEDICFAHDRMMFDCLLHDIWEIQEYLGLGKDTRDEFLFDLYDKINKREITPEEAMVENYSTTNDMLKRRHLIKQQQELIERVQNDQRAMTDEEIQRFDQLDIQLRRLNENLTIAPQKVKN